MNGAQAGLGELDARQTKKKKLRVGGEKRQAGGGGTFKAKEMRGESRCGRAAMGQQI